MPKPVQAADGTFPDVDSKKEADALFGSALSTISGRDGGIIPLWDSGDVFVTDNYAVKAQTPPDMAVDVLDGLAIFRGGFTLGNKSVSGSTITSVAIDAADASLPRIDVIALKPKTIGSGTPVPASSGEATANQVVYISGTAALQPEAPAVPQDHLCLAKVFVRAGATEINSVDIQDCRFWLKSIPELMASDEELRSQVEDNVLAIDSLSTRLSELESDFETHLTDFQNAVDALTTADAELKSDILTLANSLSSLQSDVDDIEFRLSPNGDVGSQLLDLAARIDAAEGQISDLAEDTSAALAALATLQGTVDTILTDLVDQAAQILQLQSSVSDHEDRITDLENAPSEGLTPEQLDLFEALADDVEFLKTVQDFQKVTDDVDLIDIDGPGSTFSLIDDGFALADVSENPAIFTDDFTGADGDPPDTDKWDSVNWVIDSNQLLNTSRSGLLVMEDDQHVPGGVDIGHRLTRDILHGAQSTNYDFWFRVTDPDTGDYNEIHHQGRGNSAAIRFKERRAGVVTQVKVFGFSHSVFRGNTQYKNVQTIDGTTGRWVDSDLTTGVNLRALDATFSSPIEGKAQWFTNRPGDTWRMDNFEISQIGAGTITEYAETSTILTKLLDSTDKTQRVLVSADVEIPTDTGINAGANVLTSRDTWESPLTDIFPDVNGDSSLLAPGNGTVTLKQPTNDPGDLSQSIQVGDSFDLTTMTLPRSYEFHIKAYAGYQFSSQLVGLYSPDNDREEVLFRSGTGSTTFMGGFRTGFTNSNDHIVRVTFLTSTSVQLEVFDVTGNNLLYSSPVTTIPDTVNRIMSVKTGARGAYREITFDKIVISEEGVLTNQIGDAVFEVSLDNGANWITVSPGDLTDVTGAPFNGVGGDLLARLTLSRDAGTLDVTPLVKNWSVTTLGASQTLDLVAVRDKINELVTAHNQLVADYDSGTTPTTSDGSISQL